MSEKLSWRSAAPWAQEGSLRLLLSSFSRRSTSRTPRALYPKGVFEADGRGSDCERSVAEARVRNLGSRASVFTMLDKAEEAAIEAAKALFEAQSPQASARHCGGT